MKFILLPILICFSVNFYGLPYDKSCLLIQFEISADSFIRADIVSSANWYSTIMPAYTLGISTYIPQKEMLLHEISLALYYFESNSFNFNTETLDVGTIRLLLFKSPINYLCHLSLNPIFSLIVGGKIIPQYESISNIVTYSNYMTHEDFSINLCPTFGFSIAAPKSFNFQTEFSPGLALPVINKLTFPNAPADTFEAIHGSLQIGSFFAIHISQFRIKASYNYTLNADIYFISEKYNSHLLNAKIQHYNSFGISIGYHL
ncbi:MAG: hypothetical protein JXR70_02485 [Spirochaetales bacterium]|nr:hypothetical protein [Spirochaetales bacterium]